MTTKPARYWWWKACQFDGIHPSSPFVVFSPENPYTEEFSIGRGYKPDIKSYTCWESATCFVCSNGTGVPTYHASSRGYSATSPCDTVSTVIEATSRAEALREFKSRHLRR